MHTPDKPTPGQRRIMLAAIDTNGRLRTNIASRRLLRSIPESWARTDTTTPNRDRYLTPEGRTALAPSGRFQLLVQANPETGAMPGTVNHHATLALVRDNLIAVQDPMGNGMPLAKRWDRGNTLYITERGRHLVGMPLTAPEFSKRFPLHSQALWQPEDSAGVLVQVCGWPLADDTVRVWRPNAPTYAASRERPVPTSEIHPTPEH